ncbi:DUF3563 domain-containing protein [Caballeronia sp. LZ029]|uniref:DUF3563 domain-containing protein n=1 Tax=Caballeronia sp. LZ029 TaxID=3038564 RepID=UPI00285462D8|nr:DUF3563 domain-containing protein [Caballeronia sp. LZ029]MDR5744708.1 DUF3563 domain-containing protein [Caballeronia sp. LZ029]
MSALFSRVAGWLISRYSVSARRARYARYAALDDRADLQHRMRQIEEELRANGMPLRGAVSRDRHAFARIVIDQDDSARRKEPV